MGRTRTFQRNLSATRTYPTASAGPPALSTFRGVLLLVPLSRFLLLVSLSRFLLLFPPSAPGLLAGVRRLSGVRKRAAI
jgi:hypothetical protein